MAQLRQNVYGARDSVRLHSAPGMQPIGWVQVPTFRTWDQKIRKDMGARGTGRNAL